MIKFFRHIRKSLLMEHKSAKYLKYAIGEIVLVVIGILIALSINNWNNDTIKRSESNQFNKRLLAEVNENFDLTIKNIKKIKELINSSKAILELFNKQPTDSNLKALDSLLYITIEGVKIKFRTGTLIEGLSTGKVALIEADVLKSKLYGLPSNLDFVGEYDKTYAIFLSETLLTFLYKNFNYRKMDNLYAGLKVGTSKFKSQRNKGLLENEEFENIMDNHFYQSNSQLNFHINLKNEFKVIKGLIEAELQIKK